MDEEWKKDGKDGRSHSVKDAISSLQVLEGLNHIFHQLQTKGSAASFNFDKSLKALPGYFADNGQEDAALYFTALMAALKEVLPLSQHHHLFLNISLNGILTSNSELLKTEAKNNVDFAANLTLSIRKGVTKVDELLDSYFEQETLQHNFEDAAKTEGTLVINRKIENLPCIGFRQVPR